MLGNKDKKAGGETRGPVMVRSCGTAFGKAFCCGLRCEADGGGTAAAAATTTKRGPQRRPAVLARALKTKAFLSVNADAIRDKSDWEPVIAALRGDSGNVALQVVSRSGPYPRNPKPASNVGGRAVSDLPAIVASASLMHDFVQSLREGLIGGERLTAIEIAGIALSLPMLDTLCQGLNEARWLKHFGLPRCTIGNDGMAALSPALKSVDTLRTLNFAACRLTARGAETLARSLMARAARRRDALWKAGVRGLTAAAAAAEDIYRINLCENAIGDEGAEHIARVAGNNESLRAIDLQKNCIAGGGARALLRAAENHPRLVIVDLRNNDFVGDDVAAKLMAALDATARATRADLLRFEREEGDLIALDGTDPLMATYFVPGDVERAKEKQKKESSTSAAVSRDQGETATPAGAPAGKNQPRPKKERRARAPSKRTDLPARREARDAGGRADADNAPQPQPPPPPPQQQQQQQHDSAPVRNGAWAPRHDASAAQSGAPGAAATCWDLLSGTKHWAGAGGVSGGSSDAAPPAESGAPTSSHQRVISPRSSSGNSAYWDAVSTVRDETPVSRNAKDSRLSVKETTSAAPSPRTLRVRRAKSNPTSAAGSSADSAGLRAAPPSSTKGAPSVPNGKKKELLPARLLGFAVVRRPAVPKAGAAEKAKRKKHPQRPAGRVPAAAGSGSGPGPGSRWGSAEERRVEITGLVPDVRAFTVQHTNPWGVIRNAGPESEERRDGQGRLTRVVVHTSEIPGQWGGGFGRLLPPAAAAAAAAAGARRDSGFCGGGGGDGGWPPRAAGAGEKKEAAAAAAVVDGWKHDPYAFADGRAPDPQLLFMHRLSRAHTREEAARIRIEWPGERP